MFAYFTLVINCELKKYWGLLGNRKRLERTPPLNKLCTDILSRQKHFHIFHVITKNILVICSCTVLYWAKNRKAFHLSSQNSRFVLLSQFCVHWTLPLTQRACRLWRISSVRITCVNQSFQQHRLQGKRDCWKMRKQKETQTHYLSGTNRHAEPGTQSRKSVEFLSSKFVSSASTYLTMLVGIGTWEGIVWRGAACVEWLRIQNVDRRHTMGSCSLPPDVYLPGGVHKSFLKFEAGWKNLSFRHLFTRLQWDWRTNVSDWAASQKKNSERSLKFSTVLPTAMDLDRPPVDTSWRPQLVKGPWASCQNPLLGKMHKRDSTT